MRCSRAAKCIGKGCEEVRQRQIHRHTDKLSDRQKDRQNVRQTDRQTNNVNRQTDRKNVRETGTETKTLTERECVRKRDYTGGRTARCGRSSKSCASEG